MRQDALLIFKLFLGQLWPNFSNFDHILRIQSYTLQYTLHYTVTKIHYNTATLFYSTIKQIVQFCTIFRLVIHRDPSEYLRYKYFQLL